MTTAQKPLTKEQRAERDAAAAREEERRAESLAAQYSDALRTRLQAAHAARVGENALADAAQVRADLSTRFRREVAIGKGALQRRLTEQGMPYLFAGLYAEYSLQTDAWTYQLEHYKPATPLSVAAAADLEGQLADIVAALVEGFVQQALDRRLAVELHASQWLTGWTRTRRNLPVDATDREQDAHDDREFARRTAAPEPEPDTSDKFTSAPVDGRTRRITYTVPPEDD